MGIFSRVKDIINANINAMLDKAEDPEKLVRLMIQEMEDTLVEIKASCAGAMAAKKKIGRQLQQSERKAEEWAARAETAVEKGREDLARDALLEKRRFKAQTERLETEETKCDTLIEQYQNDIIGLENKLQAAREKQRVLVQKHIHAQNRKRAERGIRKVHSSDAFLRFEKFENKIERMEAEGDLVNFGRKVPLEEEFKKLESDEEIERELENLKSSKQGTPSGKKPEKANQ